MAKYIAFDKTEFESKSDLHEYEYMESIKLFTRHVNTTLHIKQNVRDFNNEDIDKAFELLNTVFQKRYLFNGVINPLLSTNESTSHNIQQLKNEIISLKEENKSLTQQQDSRIEIYRKQIAEHVLLQDDLSGIIDSRSQECNALKQQIDELQQENATLLQKLTQQQKQPVNMQKTVTIEGSTVLKNTGLFINNGDIVYIHASGEVIYDNKGNSVTPKGESWSTEEDPMPTKPHAGLIGKILNPTPICVFYVGEQFKSKKVPEGYLYLGINDKWSKGNQGQFIITITLIRGKK